MIRGTDAPSPSHLGYRPGSFLQERPTWRAFLDNHLKNLISIDFFTVPTITFRILFMFLVLSHDRRRVLHFNVTEHPSAKWTGRQLLEAAPWDAAPRDMIRDRDGIYGHDFMRCVHALVITLVLTAPRSPWQNPYVGRLIGSIRRECLEHVIVLNESHLRRLRRRRAPLPATEEAFVFLRVSSR